jgi:hypothetical protein
MALPYVGHADYADNAVVARNLLAGRGWTVDYVTQFYRLYDGVTRPQETWPLLQPVWVAFSFAVFGVSAWAAKVPNLLFMTLLALAVYRTGSMLWDRRVGVLAVVVLITSHLYFKLVIYVTNDLGFALFAFGALIALYRAWGAPQAGMSAQKVVLLTAVSGALTGLMLLQKPGSGGLIALGMGVVVPVGALRHAAANPGRPCACVLPRLSDGVLWLLHCSPPYLARNMLTFGVPFYSTESKDAWVLEYTTWDQIYAVYTSEEGLSTLGVPDRSWILRWGFDRTLVKLERQVQALRDYLIPSWEHAPFGMGEWFGARRQEAFVVRGGRVAGAFWRCWRRSRSPSPDDASGCRFCAIYSVSDRLLAHERRTLLGCDHAPGWRSLPLLRSGASTIEIAGISNRQWSPVRVAGSRRVDCGYHQPLVARNCRKGAR